MGLLKKAVNQTAYLKGGFLGFEGSGKTHTAFNFAIGLCLLEGKKRLAAFDTETGTDYHIKRCKAAGIELHVTKSRSFKDLYEVIKEAEEEKFGGLIIDSISHVWKELTESYLRKRKRQFISLPDWGILKGEWSRSFSDPYVNSALHIMMCGRASYEYTDIINEDTGKRESVKSGTKMRVEAETGYEPSLLIEMKRIKPPLGSKKMGWKHEGIVLKDRSDLMNGKVLVNPTFKDIAPIIKFLNIGGEHLGVDTSRKSDSMFNNPDRSYEEWRIQKTIVLEEIQGALTLAGLKGTGAKVVEERTKLLIKLFGSDSKAYLEEKAKIEDLRKGLAEIKLLAKESADAAK